MGPIQHDFTHEAAARCQPADQLGPTGLLEWPQGDALAIAELGNQYA
jgi:hypothetical protein